MSDPLRREVQSEFLLIHLAGLEPHQHSSVNQLVIHALTLGVVGVVPPPTGPA